MAETFQEHIGAGRSHNESDDSNGASMPENADFTSDEKAAQYLHEGESANANRIPEPSQTPYMTNNGQTADYHQQATTYPNAFTNAYATMNGGTFPFAPQTDSTAFGTPMPFGQSPVQPQGQAYEQPFGQTYGQPLQQTASQVTPQTLAWQPFNHQASASEPTTQSQKDYSRFDNPARIAIYDDLRSAPRIIQVQGGPTHEFIERIAALTYQHAREAGGLLPYTVIREVSENFIHADFTEVVVSILDHGNTIRFSDQGPGIHNKELVQQPGFTSATEPMKRFIRGVGSGFPLMNDYLQASKGHYTIEDNVDGGAVVTISLMPNKTNVPTTQANVPKLTENEKAIMKAMLPRQVLGVTELHNATGIANSSIHAALTKMEEAGLVKKEGKSKRVLTDIGYELALAMQAS